MKRLLALPLACVLVFTLAPAFAQEQDKPMPDRWRGLILDQSTVDDALKVLGQPKSSKTFNAKGKALRYLTFKKLEGIKEAQLFFQDDRLVVISLKPEDKINAKALPNIYGIQFEPKFSGIGEAMNPQDYERHQGRTYAKTYPAVYSLIAVTEHSRIECLIDNGSFGAIMKQGMGVRDEGDFPGHVSLIQLVSRKMDDRNGAEVLK